MAQIYRKKGLTRRQPRAVMLVRKQFWAVPVIDNFSILLSHALLVIAFWRLVNRPDLDQEDPPIPDTDPEGFAHSRIAARRIKAIPPDA